MEENVGKYVNLTTITAVLLMVIYTTGKYDGWDLLIGIIGWVLSIQIYKKEYCIDFVSNWLLGIIVSISTIILGCSLLALLKCECLENLMNFGRYGTYIACVIIIIVSFVIAKICNSKSQKD